MEAARQPIASPKPAYRRGLYQGVSDVTSECYAAVPSVVAAYTPYRVLVTSVTAVHRRVRVNMQTHRAHVTDTSSTSAAHCAAVPHVRWEQRADSETRCRHYTTPKADRDTCMGAKYTGTNHRAATPARQHRGPSHPVSRA